MDDECPKVRAINDRYRSAPAPAPMKAPRNQVARTAATPATAPSAVTEAQAPARAPAEEVAAHFPFDAAKVSRALGELESLISDALPPGDLSEGMTLIARVKACFPRQARGFTLIEVMIAAAIIVILALIALPSYREMMLNGYRSEATSGLQNAAAVMERCYSVAMSYVGCEPPAQTETGLYLIEVDEDSLTNLSYTLTAIRENQRVLGDGRCGDFTLTSTGQRGNIEGEEQCW